MTDPVTLDLVDPEAVIHGGGRNEGGLTRAALFRRAAIAGSAVLGGGVLLSGVPKAFGQGTTDVEILNVALLEEYLESAFYAQAAASGALRGRALEFAQQLAETEAVHRDTIRGALGSAAIPSPAFDFRGTTANQQAFLTTALALENTDVGAFNGAGPLLKSKAILAVAGQIVSVEGRQAAWIRRIVYGPGGYAGGAAQYPAPRAFDPGLTLAQVRAVQQATGFIRG
jgi:hypothetical protein